jgi:hypothetical protein
LKHARDDINCTVPYWCKGVLGATPVLAVDVEGDLDSSTELVTPESAAKHLIATYGDNAWRQAARNADFCYEWGATEAAEVWCDALRLLTPASGRTTGKRDVPVTDPVVIDAKGAVRLRK